MKTWIVILIFLAGLFGILNGFQVTGIGKAHAFVGPDPNVIPQDALRFRVIANSNSPWDQNLKRDIRNRVIAFIGEKMAHVTSVSQAQIVLQHSVPEVEAIAIAMLKKYHAPYGATTTFGFAHFPTKLYGDKVYPAGTYKALRITLGKGAGQNWWCVLFPPLCFVALSDGDAVAATAAFPDYPPLAVRYIKNPDGKGRIPVALRLAVVDYGEELLKVIRADFAHLTL
ncbi:stage II sporulation protein R [Sulfoacidibacillus thermotolerans]|uniref:Stage II sporulation protein R n=1 Tax=Sulfoacidibacillus thermotolerans TaxID=1765684 RepID=A0A2U3D9K5_SULT2|nr:stage II sporulation protein R [Sulfoacidibacillus thermotolerans]PWI57964.1 stage II sporulation protein R [Sulfoacidibacillus thermotolerans]